MAIDLRANYDEGCFDKDEQGWCSRCVEVTTAGEQVTIRRHGDDNGLRPYDETTVGMIGAAWPELGLVQIVEARGVLAYFDTRTGRLRSPGEQVLHRFQAPAGLDEAGFFAAAGAIVASVAAALGANPGPPPTPVVLPPAVPGRHGSGLESVLTTPGEDGCVWVLSRRTYPDNPDLGAHLDVRVERRGVWVSLFLGAERQASLLLIGPLERHHLATAARDQALAAWCA